MLPYFAARQSLQASGRGDPATENELAQQEIEVSARVALFGVWLRGTCDF